MRHLAELAPGPAILLCFVANAFLTCTFYYLGSKLGTTVTSRLPQLSSQGAVRMTKCQRSDLIAIVYFPLGEEDRG